MRTAKKITSRLHEPGINCWGEDSKENRLVTYYNPKKKKESSQPTIVMFEKKKGQSNGPIGWIDLSNIKDNRGRRFR